MSRYFDSNESITHYGVLGMKWGIRRYQPYSYTGGGSGKEVGEAAKKGKGSAKEKIAGAIKKHKKKKQLEKARAAKIEKQKQKENAEALKQKQIKEITKNATTLHKNQELAREILSNEEYDKVRNRLQNEQSVYELHNKRIDRGRQAVENVLKWSSTGIKAVNAFNTWNKILNGQSVDNKKAKSSDKKNELAKSIFNKNIKKETGKDLNDIIKDLKEVPIQTDPRFLLEDKKRS